MPGGSCGHLGAIGESFSLSWSAFWPHVDSLGTLFFPFWLSWDVLGRLFRTSWPKIAKKSSIFAFKFRKLDQVGKQSSRKIDAENRVFLRCIFDIDFIDF